MYNFTQLLTSSPLTLYIIFVFLYLITFEKIFIIFIFLFFIFGFIFNISLKSIFRQNRPYNAGNCGLYTNLYKNNSYGMPSMHAQIWAIFSLFWSIYLIRKPHPTKHYIISIIIFWILFFIVCWQRVNSKCHNTWQVLVGSIVGFISAIVMYIICNCIDNKKFP